MSEDELKIKEWKYDFAWKQLENAQVGNERLDNKAMSIINFSSLIIPITIGILLFFTDKVAMGWFHIFMIISLFCLIISIFFAFIAIWLRDQGIIETNDQFSAIKNDDIKKIIGSTSQDLANWQKKVVDAGIDKSYYLLISSLFFIGALNVIIIGGIYLLFF